MRRVGVWVNGGLVCALATSWIVLLPTPISSQTPASLPALSAQPEARGLEGAPHPAIAPAWALIVLVVSCSLWGAELTAAC